MSKSKIPQSAIEANLEYSDLRLNGSEVAAFGHLEGFSYPASKGIISMAFDDTRGLDFAVLAKLALDLVNVVTRMTMRMILTVARRMTNAQLLLRPWLVELLLTLYRGWYRALTKMKSRHGNDND